MSKVYVGVFEKCPADIKPFTIMTHPRDFSPLNHDVFTNNPCLVDKYKCEDVLVISKNGNITPLNTHPDWEKWREELRPGEFWSMVGEEWVSEETEPPHVFTSNKKCVHTEHCCAEVGCKYGDKNCPVWLGYAKQSYAYDDGFDSYPIPNIRTSVFEQRRLELED